MCKYVCFVLKRNAMVCWMVCALPVQLFVNTMHCNVMEPRLFGTFHDVSNRTIYGTIWGTSCGVFYSDVLPFWCKKYIDSGSCRNRRHLSLNHFNSQFPETKTPSDYSFSPTTSRPERLREKFWGTGRARKDSVDPWVRKAAEKSSGLDAVGQRRAIFAWFTTILIV